MIRILALALLICPAAVMAQDLRAPESFDDIADPTRRSQALFQELGRVIESPRCMNCHPRGDSPTQKDGQPHVPPVVRGADGRGAPGMECTTCHGVEPARFATGDGSVPGHDDWHLAPLSMGWQGLTLSEICMQLKDPERNGDRTLAEIAEHHADDGLVGSAWAPGPGREPAPGTQEVFGALTRAWIETGAACP